MSKRILIIDDEEHVGAMLRTKLHRHGDFEVYTTTDPVEGLEWAFEVPPDLIVCDIDMPGMTGLEVEKRLRAADKTRGVPLAFLTSMIRANEVGVLGDGLSQPYAIPKDSGLPVVIERLLELLS